MAATTTFHAIHRRKGWLVWLCENTRLRSWHCQALLLHLHFAVGRPKGAIILGRIRGTLKREPLLSPLLARLKRDLTERVYIPQGPPNPKPYIRHLRNARTWPISGGASLFLTCGGIGSPRSFPVWGTHPFGTHTARGMTATQWADALG